MAIWLWLAKMDRPLSENEYHDMLELLPEDRRLRLERIPRESIRRFCAPICCCGWPCMTAIAGEHCL